MKLNRKILNKGFNQCDKKLTTLNHEILVAFCTDSIIDNKKSGTKKDYICYIMIILIDIGCNKIRLDNRIMFLKTEAARVTNIVLHRW